MFVESMLKTKAIGFELGTCASAASNTTIREFNSLELSSLCDLFFITDTSNSRSTLQKADSALGSEIRVDSSG